jgi:hypothetical protein
LLYIVPYFIYQFHFMKSFHSPSSIYFIRSLFLVSSISLWALWGCMEDVEERVDEDTLEVANDVVLDFAFEDLDGLAVSAVVRQFAEGDLPSDRRLVACAIVTHDAVNKIITIDFGNGCRGVDNRYRKGKVFVSYEGWILHVGSQLVVEPENYFIDQYKVEGVRTLTNITKGEEPVRWEVVLEEGKVVWSDGTYATLEGTFVKVWRRGANPSADEFDIFGEGEGKNRKGVNFSVTIEETSALTVKVSCLADRVNVPVKGVKTYRANNRELSIDYGVGQCNHRVIIRYNGFALEANLAGRI